MAAATPRNQPYQLASNTTTPIAVAMDDSSAFQQLGFKVLLVFLFLAFSRLFDVKFGSLHITGAAYRLVFIMAMLSGGFKIALKTNIGKAMLGLTIFFGLAVPFSVWRGGSKDVFLNQWLTFSFVAFLSVAGLIRNYPQWLKVFKTLAYAIFAFALIANIWGVNDNGRLFLTQGKFSNPNEMAQALLMGLPLWGVMLAVAKSMPAKVVALGVMTLIVATTFRTGSRGAMIGFLATLLVVFLRASVLGKIKIILATVICLGVMMATMSSRLIARYKSVADADAEVVEEMGGAMASSAISSTQSRKMLLKHSVIFTLRNPLFGVGPGMFPLVDDAYMKELGFKKGIWLGTHNSYTEVSSELGIPALLFFVSAIGMALIGPLRIYKKTRGDVRLEDLGTAALGLHYCMIIYATTIVFEHIAYTVMLPVFGGLAAALTRAAEVEIQRVKSAPMPVTMSHTAFHSYLSRRPTSGQQY